MYSCLPQTNEIQFKCGRRVYLQGFFKKIEIFKVIITTIQ
jgi:hypothetical protein